MKYVTLIIILFASTCLGQVPIQVLNQQLQQAAQGAKLNPVRRPVYNRVGYAPVIIWLPQGASLGVSAVVSHDRCYVRIGCNPMFSKIGPVRTFSYQR